jgi:iduronate 2-sulfatase
MNALTSLLTLATATLSASAAATTNLPPRYNVLFIISDDMRTEPGCYGGKAITPNIDKLAATGVRFDRAYAQYPLCCPSRTSMLTGHPATHTGVLGNRTWVGDVHPEYVSLPRWFKDHGYVTARAGKIFHDGIDDTDAWMEGGEARWLAGAGSETNSSRKARLNRERQSDRTAGNRTNNAPKSTGSSTNGILRNTDPDQTQQRSDRWIVLAGNGETDHDYRVANQTIEQLGKYKNQPFFLACGFAKPHSPPSAPQSCYDLYSLTNIAPRVPPCRKVFRNYPSAPKTRICSSGATPPRIKRKNSSAPISPRARMWIRTSGACWPNLTA